MPTSWLRAAWSDINCQAFPLVRAEGLQEPRTGGGVNTADLRFTEMARMDPQNQAGARTLCPEFDSQTAASQRLSPSLGAIPMYGGPP